MDKRKYSKGPDQIKVLDQFISEVSKALPQDFSFEFFITKRESSYLQGVWFLKQKDYPVGRKEVQREDRKIRGKEKLG